MTVMLNAAESQLTAPMDELEFYRILAHLMAELQCGHSFLSVSSEKETYRKKQGSFFPWAYE